MTIFSQDISRAIGFASDYLFLASAVVQAFWIVLVFDQECLHMHVDIVSHYLRVGWWIAASIL